eukprot:m.78895 g.78895  ORF g.78895 m.78895 type:complete len:525 (-) comp14134_c0_seq1:176-1750(-)
MGQTLQRSQQNHNARRSGMYFGENFTLAGQEFQSMTPESFLFGDMADLNLLGQISGSMPRVPAQVKHTNTLRALVNLHRNSVKLIRHADQDEPLAEYHLAFAFDADCSCEVHLHFFVEEVLGAGGLTFRKYRETGPIFDVKRFPVGFNQVYDFPEDVITSLHGMTQEELDYHIEDNKLFFPLAIELRAVGSGHLKVGAAKHCQVTYCAFDKNSDNAISIRTIAQKVHIDGVTYLLREIYGLEHKGDVEGDDDDDDAHSDAGPAEDDHDCVVCMSSPMDTMVLPCRHLCLCNDCAEVLRYQSSKCPICRAAFHSVLRLRVAKKVEDLTQEQLDSYSDEQEETPTGYHAIPIAEALKQQPNNDGYIEIAESPQPNEKNKQVEGGELDAEPTEVLHIPEEEPERTSSASSARHPLTSPARTTIQVQPSPSVSPVHSQRDSDQMTGNSLQQPVRLPPLRLTSASQMTSQSSSSQPVVSPEVHPTSAVNTTNENNDDHDVDDDEEEDVDAENNPQASLRAVFNATYQEL